MIQDTDIATALSNAATAQTTADGKMKVFSAQPVPPYQVGDLWAQGSSGELLRCKTEKKAGENFAKDDWENACKYTDDTSVDALR
jgi:phage-related protein